MKVLKIANISAYKFEKLVNLDELKKYFLDLCSELNLKGTILLSPEGINIALAGEIENIKIFKNKIKIKNLPYKENLSESIPFKKLLIKIKSEIIPMGHDIDPAVCTGKRLAPKEFKQWLDNNKEMLVLDTRNEFEFTMGTFKNATQINLSHFREFPEKAKLISEQWKDKPIVTFCTGGVRCEKVTPLLMEMGFTDVYQLDGGILEYFKQCDGEYFDGECFVFDERISIPPSKDGFLDQVEG